MTGFKIRPYQLDCFKPSSFEKIGQGQAEKQNWAHQDMTARQSHRISPVIRPTGGLAAAETVPMVRQNAAETRQPQFPAAAGNVLRRKWCRWCDKTLPRRDARQR